MAGVCFLHHLDELVAGGCQSPVCPHEHSDGLFLAPFCHGPVGVCVGITDEVEGLPCDAVLQLRCWRCHAEITQVAIVAPVTDFHSCAHEQACDVLYNRHYRK